MKLRFWRLFPFGIFFLLAIFLWRGLSLDPSHLPSAQLGQALPQFKLPVLGLSDKHLTPAAFKGRWQLLNIWASWCAACIEEQVFLLDLKGQGVPIIGLNYKDDPEKASSWLKEWGNPYQIIAEDRLGKVAIDLGVYGAPETFLVDDKGIIRYRHVGVLDASSWKKEFLPLIKQLGRGV